MKLQEIKNRLEDLAQMRIGETYDDYAQRRWDDLPRMPFKKLPVSLQKDVRERFMPESILEFLQTCYAPHVPFETLTEGIPEDDIYMLAVRTRNTAVYTVEYESPKQPAAMLYGNHALEAFEKAVDEYRENQKEKQERKKAKEQGLKPQQRQRASNLVSAGIYQYVISDKTYQYGLSTQQNQHAYIALMKPEFFKRLDFANGVLTFDQEIAGIVKQYKLGKYTDIQDLDLPLLTQFYTAAAKSNVRHDAFTITVSIPLFFREMGIEMSKGNAPDIMAKLHSFEHCVGIMPGMQTISKLFVILDMDMKNQTMTFAVPYIMRLLETLDEKNHIEKTTKQGKLIDYRKPYHNTLVHSNIAKERNKTAVELVYAITNGLLQRGYTPDCKTYRKRDAVTKYPNRITYSVKFTTLINDTPLLRGRIQSYEDTANKNNALRRAFEKAYQLLEEKTDAKEWFINLKYNAIIPTMATLDNELIFTHEGRNGDYKPKKWGEVY